MFFKGKRHAMGSMKKRQQRDELRGMKKRRGKWPSHQGKIQRGIHLSTGKISEGDPGGFLWGKTYYPKNREEVHWGGGA